MNLNGKKQEVAVSKAECLFLQICITNQLVWKAESLVQENKLGAVREGIVTAFE